MNLKVGMYVRLKGFKDCGFGKLHEPIEDTHEWVVECDDGFYNFNPIHDFKKASYNIIDLIEAGDYVNGNEIEQILNNKLWFDASDMRECCIEPNQIESIVTKEKFESMKYNVGGN